MSEICMRCSGSGKVYKSAKTLECWNCKGLGRLGDVRVGFTGTQKGMTVNQEFALEGLLREINPTEFHHGDCIGADDWAHRVAIRCGVGKVVIHPPSDSRKRAFCKGADIVLPAEQYLARNKKIVDQTDYLIATPEGAETLRSGTWSTVRYARKLERPGRIIYANGHFVIL